MVSLTDAQLLAGDGAIRGAPDGNANRVDLTKEQRDEHIRRYAELLAERQTGDANCVGSLADGRAAGPQHQQGVASQIATETGVSKDTVRRALNPERAARENSVSRQFEAKLSTSPV